MANIIPETDATFQSIINNEASKNDIIIDCTDSFETRYLINDICQKQKKSLVFGGAIKFDGQFTCFEPKKDFSPCLRCIFPESETSFEQSPRCSQVGIIGAITMIIGSLQALEAIKLITGIGDTSTGKLILFDGKNLTLKEIKVMKNPSCSCQS